MTKVPEDATEQKIQVKRSQMWNRPEKLNMLVISSAGQLLLLRRFTGTTTEGTFSGVPATVTGMIKRFGEQTIRGEAAEHVTPVKAEGKQAALVLIWVCVLKAGSHKDR